MTDHIDLGALEAFVRARLAETHLHAEQASFATRGPWYDIQQVGGVFANMPPARILANLGATRAILRMLRLAARFTADGSVEHGMYLEALQQVAAVYADHPDYREVEWALTCSATAQPGF